jgi:hypothetical protein
MLQDSLFIANGVLVAEVGLHDRFALLRFTDGPA